ncbi:hypothetical protein KJ865_03550 [Myxococcota bacterium]|nr:hypothetical protein [Myxococcota bacterium]
MKVVGRNEEPVAKPNEAPELKKTPARMMLTFKGEQFHYDKVTLSGPGFSWKFHFHPLMGFELDFGLLLDHDSDRRDMRFEMAFLFYFFEDSRSFMNMYARGAFVNNVIFLPDSFETSEDSQMQLGLSAGFGADYRISKWAAASLEAGYTYMFATPEVIDSYGILGNHKGWYLRLGFSFSVDFTMTETPPTPVNTFEPPR